VSISGSLPTHEDHVLIIFNELAAVKRTNQCFINQALRKVEACEVLIGNVSLVID
jgi:hypothetical protein